MFKFMFNFAENRRYYFIFSGVLMALSALAMIVSFISVGAPFTLGVDFRGGTRFEIQFEEPVTEEQVQAVFEDAGYDNLSIIALRGDNLQNAWQIRLNFLTPEEGQALETALAELSPLIPGTTQIVSVSPAVGKEVTLAAVGAIIVAAIVILIYIMLAFRQVPNPFRYGAAAVTAMLHDLMIVFGFAAIAGMFLGWEVDALFLTAVLTVAGFSLQDTIVMFDRIRENIGKRPLERYELIVNRSVLETMHRSFVTQLNAMFVMVAILLFGGVSIKPFIAVLFIGMLSGTYSSIFTAVPLLVSWEKGELPFVKNE